jgi:hypothetical protein
MDNGLARYHRGGLPRPDRFLDHLRDRLGAGSPTPEDARLGTLLEALRCPPTAVELERRAVVVPRLAAIVRIRARRRHRSAGIRA